MWPVLGLIKSEHIDRMPGGISAFMANILELCFADGQHSGIQIVYKNERSMLQCEYGGIMADEDALKKVHGYNGAQGLKPCMDCGNLVRNTDVCRPAGLISLSAVTLDDVDFNTNEDIWEMADVLRELAEAGRPYTAEQKAYGLKYNEHGLLYNMRLRQVHRPIDHYIRDWMHILVSGGSANVQTAFLAHALKSNGLPTLLLQQYSLEVVLPKNMARCPQPGLTQKGLEKPTSLPLLRLC